MRNNKLHSLKEAIFCLIFNNISNYVYFQLKLIKIGFDVIRLLYRINIFKRKTILQNSNENDLDFLNGHQ